MCARNSDLSGFCAQLRLAHCGGGNIAVGLVPPRLSATLSNFIDGYIARRTDAARNKIVNFTQAGKKLKAHFGGDHPMRTITAADADKFAIKMRTELAPATAACHIKFAKHFWEVALRDGVIDADIWSKVKTGSMANAERQAFITRADIAKVLNVCRDPEWQLIVALCRFARRS